MVFLKALGRGQPLRAGSEIGEQFSNKSLDGWIWPPRYQAMLKVTTLSCTRDTCCSALQHPMCHCHQRESMRCSQVQTVSKTAPARLPGSERHCGIVLKWRQFMKKWNRVEKLVCVVKPFFNQFKKRVLAKLIFFLYSICKLLQERNTAVRRWWAQVMMAFWETHTQGNCAKRVSR